ncbi:MAG: hypothetical protein QOG57_2909 [Pseudonocardiales bacterium]|nr:hypothetical protein [Pseudonocardiales bacterium]
MDSAGLNRGLTNYGDAEFARYLRRSFSHSTGRSADLLDRPVVGIATSTSDFNNCHRSQPELVESVKRGVLAAGGLPMEFPTISLGEGFLNPTAMMFRNLMAMDVEEMVRAQPMDAVVLIGGCDKTVPAQLMGAFSAGRPAIQLVAGPMMTGRHRGERTGACTDCRRFWAQFRAGEISREEVTDVEQHLATTAGTCAVMGTASTMACIAEAMGIALPGSATPPAVHADRLRVGEATGRTAMQLALSGRSPADIVSPASIRNALRVLLAIGGSSNALIHLTAIAGRLGIPIDPRQLNQISDDTPTLVALKPTGSHYMEDFHASGGVPALLHRLRDSLELDAMTVTGQTLGQLLDAPAPWSDPHVVHPVDDPDLDVEPDDFLVLRNAGPVATGMPEAGYLPIPAKLAARGVRDMVRLSDARMSGTAYGTIVLHITPEAAIGGPLALVRDGDRISLSVRTARLDLLVDENELQRRRAALPAEETRRSEYGYRKLFRDHVLQADHGCDFDYCVPAPNADLAEDVPTNLVARSDRTGPARR